MFRRNRSCQCVAFALCLHAAISLKAHAVEPVECLSSDALPQTVADASLVILGEIHGTVESPRFAAQLLCTLASTGREVILGLEILDHEQAAIDDFLRHPTAEDFMPTVGSSFWNSSFRDGRSSAAMVALVSQVKALRSDGLSVSILAFDGPIPAGGNRDRLMAAKVQGEMDIRSDATALLLTGRIHAGKNVGAPFDADFQSMANRLLEFSPISLSMGHSGGTAWVCQGTACGPTPFQPEFADGDADSPIQLRSDLATGFDGVYMVGTINASPPALEN